MTDSSHSFHLSLMSERAVHAQVLVCDRVRLADAADSCRRRHFSARPELFHINLFILMYVSTQFVRNAL